MEPAARCPPRGLACLLLLWLLGWTGAGAQEFQVLQPQGTVSVSAGGTLTLNCSVTAAVPVGPMKWFKGSGPSRQLVYEDRDKGSFPRVSKALPDSNTDFTIHISDTRPEDAGTYRCVKFRKVAGGEEELSSGPGTVVSVSARPSAPSVSGPRSRAEPGAPVSFTCTSEGFSPRDITVTWFKNGDKLEAPRPQVLPEHENVSYSVSSTVGLSLSTGDARSQLTCQLEHSALLAPLRGTYSLNRTLRVPPQLRVDPKPDGPIPVNTLVTFTCHAEGFYPSNVSLSWLQNGNETRLGKSSHLAENADGRYTLQSSLEVNATEQMDQSNFICQVVHDSQPPINISKSLHVSQPNAESGKDSNGPGALSHDERTIYIAVAVVCAVLVVLVIAVVYLVRIRQRKGKSSPSARLHEPEKSPSAAAQDSDPNNLTYADLNFDKQQRQSVRQLVEMSPPSEYASIQPAKPAASNDNLTYADLDMVHLSKAPKRPAPRPEEVTSEYASVQIQRK